MALGGRSAVDRAEELFLRHAQQIHAFCLYRLGDPMDAEDALQSTFLNAFRALERGVVPYAESAWLYTIARNVCLTRRRSVVRRRRLESLTPLDDSVPSPDRDAEQLFDLTGALHRLPHRQRHALVLREWQGLNYEEIASELGLTQAAVETLLHRARCSLRAAA
jgi:RNA polymerase sigma-70 factor (ECF subfamily)